MGRLTLLVIIALAAPARAETQLRLAFDASRESPRTEVARRSTPAALRPIDLSAFAVARSQLFTRIEVPAPPELELFEVRDNVSREWAPDRDFELAAMWSALSIAINHHVLDRNWDEAQITATLTREL